MHLVAELRPDRLGELIALPQTPSWIKKSGQGRGVGKGKRKGREGKGDGRGRGKNE